MSFNDNNNSLNRDLAKKRRRLLGECQGNCNSTSKCAPQLKCARYNQQIIRKAGYDVQFVYCDSSQIFHKRNKYWCYNPITLKNAISCPINPFIDCGVTFSGECLLTVYPDFHCCRSPIIIVNTTHATCEKYQTCQTSVICQCGIDDIIGSFTCTDDIVCEHTCIN